MAGALEVHWPIRLQRKREGKAESQMANAVEGSKVLVVGGGGREHALAWRLSQEAEVHIAPGNAGAAEVSTCHDVAATDVPGLVALAQRLGITLVVVGPEAPLVDGLVDALSEVGIPAFGPNAAAAQLEASKAFSKELMREAGVPTADFGVFEDASEAKAWVRERGRPMVVKADGLAAGKGVIVADTVEGTCAAVDRILDERAFGDAGARLVVEERLEGQEVSFHVLCDGARMLPLATAQDHKRAFDGDQGPNTGGMGAYSPASWTDEGFEGRVMERVVAPTIAAMAARGTPFRGVLFVGLMVHTGMEGREPFDFSVLEFNVRFGDPECEVLMARLGGALLPCLQACAAGELTEEKAKWDAPAAMCVVLASGGYPGAYEKGKPIEGVATSKARVFHAGTRRDAGQLYTAGGRVLAVTATGADLDEAAEAAYGAVDGIDFEGKQWRTDIGWQVRQRRLPGD